MKPSISKPQIIHFDARKFGQDTELITERVKSMIDINQTSAIYVVTLMPNAPVPDLSALFVTDISVHDGAKCIYYCLDVDKTVRDLCDLPAPEPMEKILYAVSDLETGEIQLFRLPHVPRPLFRRLKERNLPWAYHEEPSGRAVVVIGKVV